MSRPRSLARLVSMTLQVGVRACLLPCGHVYHEGCHREMIGEGGGRVPPDECPAASESQYRMRPPFSIDGTGAKSLLWDSSP